MKVSTAIVPRSGTWITKLHPAGHPSEQAGAQADHQLYWTCRSCQSRTPQTSEYIQPSIINTGDMLGPQLLPATGPASAYRLGHVSCSYLAGNTDGEEGGERA
jgi:hypothetical protein